MENTEQETNKIAIGARVDPKVHDAITKLAKQDERTLSWMIERLIMESPKVQEILSAHPAGVTA